MMIYRSTDVNVCPNIRVFLGGISRGSLNLKALNHEYCAVAYTRLLFHQTHDQRPGRCSCHGEVEETRSQSPPERLGGITRAGAGHHPWVTLVARSSADIPPRACRSCLLPPLPAWLYSAP